MDSHNSDEDCEQTPSTKTHNSHKNLSRSISASKHWLYSFSWANQDSPSPTKDSEFKQDFDLFILLLQSREAKMRRIQERHAQESSELKSRIQELSTALEQSHQQVKHLQNLLSGCPRVSFFQDLDKQFSLDMNRLKDTYELKILNMRDEFNQLLRGKDQQIEELSKQKARDTQSIEKHYQEQIETIKLEYPDRQVLLDTVEMLNHSLAEKEAFVESYEKAIDELSKELYQNKHRKQSN